MSAAVDEHDEHDEHDETADVVMSNTSDEFPESPVQSGHLAKTNGSPTRSSSPQTPNPTNLSSFSPPAKRSRTSKESLDCYPYTFSPLLLFSQSNYFDKGYSNYNSVARFFNDVLSPLGINMLENVLYDRKNMLYDELFEVSERKENQTFGFCTTTAAAAATVPPFAVPDFFLRVRPHARRMVRHLKRFVFLVGCFRS